jgi:hypothetical protein
VWVHELAPAALDAATDELEALKERFRAARGNA